MSGTKGSVPAAHPFHHNNQIGLPPADLFALLPYATDVALMVQAPISM